MDPSIRKLTPDERFAILNAENLEQRRKLKASLSDPGAIHRRLEKMQARPTLSLKAEFAPRAFIKDGKVESLTFNLVSPANGKELK